jgi:DNA primase
MATAHTADELKALIEPHAIYQDYVKLARRGKRSVGLCPFHKERTPSFSVDSDNGLFYCFGCHKGGDLLQFIQEMERCSFPEALEILARKGGISYEPRSAGKPQAPDRRERLRKLLQSASAHYRSVLKNAPAGSPVRDYVKRRGILPATEEALGLGFAPPAGGLLSQLSREGFSAEEAQEVGLVMERSRGEWTERFRNRLIFPIVDLMGRTVGFGGRALGDEEPKYLNSPESPVFQKREVLYGLNLSKGAVKEREQLLVVEGYMDYLAVTQAGVPFAAATLGTALAEGQVRIVKRYAKEVVLNFDQDPAGLAASQRAIQILLAEGMRIRVAVVPDGKDPDEFIRKNGAQAYARLIERAEPFFDFVVDRARPALEGGDVAAKMAFVEEVTPYLSCVSDALERQEYAKEVAGRAGLDPGLVLKRLAKAAAGSVRSAPAPAGRMPIPVMEQVLVRGLLAFPAEGEELMKGLPAEALRELQVAPLVQSLLRNGRPEGPEQTALLAFVQNSCHEAQTVRDLESAVDTVREKHLRQRERLIQQQIREASRRKDYSLVQILNREKMALLREIQAIERP